MTVLDERAHVFVVGSPRSGTSLVASILQSSTVYAIYRAETKLLAGCKDIYGDLSSVRVRRRFWDDWFRSRQFKRTGLSREDILPVVEDQRSYIGILSEVMGLVTARQGRERWIDSTPDNSYHLEEISAAFPNARIVHVIRDGRAVALSLAKLGWTGIKTGNFDKALCYSGLKWQHAITDIQKARGLLDERYFEVRYEELVQSPQAIVNGLCEFLEIPMIDDSLLGSGFNNRNEDVKSTLHTPNSPFGDMSSGISPRAMFRWKEVLSKNQVCSIEAHISNTLNSLEYPLMCDESLSPATSILPSARKLLLALKSILKQNTFLGRFSVSPFEFETD